MRNHIVLKIVNFQSAKPCALVRLSAASCSTAGLRPRHVLQPPRTLLRPLQLHGGRLLLQLQLPQGF